MFKMLTFLICILPLGPLKPFFLNKVGHSVHKNAKVGVSIVWGAKLIMKEGSRIKKLNIVRNKSISLEKNATVGSLNYISGGFDIVLSEGAMIINLNSITRGRACWKEEVSFLKLGINSQITSFASLDLASNILIGNDTVLAGKGIQMWTHGFVHKKNRDRKMVVGAISIGNNVYVAARSAFNPGVSVSDDISIGINTTVAKDLNLDGLYVSSPVRYISIDPEAQLEKMKEVRVDGFSYFEKK